MSRFEAGFEGRFNLVPHQGQEMADGTVVAPNQAVQLLGANGTRDTVDGLAARNSADLNDTIAPDFLDTQGNTKDSPTVVARALKESTFPKASERYLREKIEDLVVKGKGTVSPALAGRILARSQGQEASMDSLAVIPQQLSKGLNALTGGWLGSDDRDLGDGVTIDSERVKGFLNEVKSGRVNDNVSLVKQREGAASQLKGAQAEYDFALQQAQQGQTMLSNGDPRVKSVMPKLLQRLQRAKVQLEMSNALANSNPTQTYNGKR